MSTTSEALVQLAEQKEQLRIIANRYLDSADRLPVDCTLQDIIDVLNEYDEYTYMNALFNSIEVFPDKDYSINDTKGHIKGLRPYAFYNNTALKSVNLPAVTNFDGSLFSNCSNLKKVVIGPISIDNVSGFGALPIEEISMPNLTSIVGSGGAKSAIFQNLSLLTRVYLPKLSNLSSYSNTFSGCVTLKNVNLPSLTALTAYYCFHDCDSLKSILVGGRATISDRVLFNGKNLLTAFVLTNNDGISTLGGSSVTNNILSTNAIVYVPASLVSSYQSATNWTTINAQRPIQDIESNINDLRELGADFSFTPYANKKWENDQLIDDPTIGEEVDE